MPKKPNDHPTTDSALEYDRTINWRIGDSEVTIFYCHTLGGDTELTCHYCGRKEGHECGVRIVNMTIDGTGEKLSSKSTQWKKALARLKRCYLDGRIICAQETCYDKLNADRDNAFAEDERCELEKKKR